MLRAPLTTLVGELRCDADDPVLSLFHHGAFFHVKEGLAGRLSGVFINAYLHECLLEALGCEYHRIVLVRRDLVDYRFIDLQILNVLAVQNLGDACCEILASLGSDEICILLQDWVIRDSAEEALDEHLELLLLLEGLDEGVVLTQHLFILRHRLLVLAQEVEEVYDCWFRCVVFDASSIEVLDESFKVFLGD